MTAPSGESFKLEEADALVLPRGSAYTAADAPDSPIGPSCVPAESRREDGFILRSDPDEESSASHIALCFSYELAPVRTHPLLTSMPDFVHLPADQIAQPELAGAIAMLDKELQLRRSGGDAIVPALLDGVLMYSLRGWLGRRADECGFNGWAAALSDRSIAAALESLHADPARQWTVASLGAVAGLSRSAFSRKFTELVGQPPLTYLTSWRLTLAARLLTANDAPLSSIAKRVGYASQFAFASAFKRAFGMAPGRFRKDTPTCRTEGRGQISPRRAGT